ncbi:MULTISPECIES: hypothetical protein [Nocardiopsis]|uniref:hypothetical protein n=1 Tax=Nocardiopsis TaxID=2013 RepID=UPI00034C10CE|nr:hypothetical protein [Nocardiopsis prasina]
MTGFRKLSLLAATAVVLTACSPGGPPRDGTAVVGDDPRVVVHDLSFGPDMLLVLTLEYVPEHGCLLVRTIDAETGEPGEVLTPIWPSDVEPLNTGGQAGVTVPEVGELVDGDSFTSGGSHTDASELDEVPDLPGECLPEGGFVTINQGSVERGAPVPGQE